MEILIERVWEYAQITPSFTLNISEMQPVVFGIVVAYGATQNSFGKESLDGVIAHALEHENMVGGWTDSETDLWHFDSVRVFKNSEIKEAIEFAMQNEQYAIFDLTNLKEIRIKKGE